MCHTLAMERVFSRDLGPVNLLWKILCLHHAITKLFLETAYIMTEELFLKWDEFQRRFILALGRHGLLTFEGKSCVQVVEQDI